MNNVVKMRPRGDLKLFECLQRGIYYINTFIMIQWSQNLRCCLFKLCQINGTNKEKNWLIINWLIITIIAHHKRSKLLKGTSPKNMLSAESEQFYPWTESCFSSSANLMLKKEHINKTQATKTQWKTHNIEILLLCAITVYVWVQFWKVNISQRRLMLQWERLIKVRQGQL